MDFIEASGIAKLVSNEEERGRLARRIGQAATIRLEAYAQAELQIARQIRLRIGKRSEVRIIDRRLQTSEKVAIGNVKSRSTEFDVSPLPSTEREIFADGHILIQLIRLI
jgi:uncharacterized protein with PIN domain